MSTAPHSTTHFAHFGSRRSAGGGAAGGGPAGGVTGADTRAVAVAGGTLPVARAAGPPLGASLDGVAAPPVADHLRSHLSGEQADGPYETSTNQPIEPSPATNSGCAATNWSRVPATSDW